jgi:ubiquitin carboxyl-terminal hydrolase L5
MDPSANDNREKEDAYHFVTYLPVNGCLYELDGLRKDPLMHGPVNEENWLDKARDTIQARISTYPMGSVSLCSLSFNMGMTRGIDLRLTGSLCSICCVSDRPLYPA